LRFYWLLIGSLAVWRITHLFQAEDGPWHAFVRLRRLAGSGSLGALLDCFYCLSLWIAAPIAYGLQESWKEWLLLWPALSGAAILLERLTTPRESAVAAYFEESEGHDVLLRESERPDHGTQGVG
jgi:hypothetical protein